MKHDGEITEELLIEDFAKLWIKSGAGENGACWSHGKADGAIGPPGNDDQREVPKDGE